MWACLIKKGQREAIKDALFSLVLHLCSLNSQPVVLWTDWAPYFVSLVNDDMLSKYGISIETGCVESINKNQVAGKTIQKLELGLLHQCQIEDSVSSFLLFMAVARLNICIREKELSSCKTGDEYTEYTEVCSSRSMISF